MNTVNRHVLIVRCRKPYVDWANQCCGDGPKLEESNEKHTVYLVAERESDFDGSKTIRESWDEVFEMELEAWFTDESVWPEHRTLKMFREWFEVSFSSIVVDLGVGRIEVDEG